ncbi:MAG: hypothetical protein ACLR6T_04745 [Intestinibacter sp.]
MYNLFIQGHGTFEIADFTERNILTPSEYFASIGKLPTNTKFDINNYNNSRSILEDKNILEILLILNTIRSYKDKTKLIFQKRRKIFKNTHEPIIDEYTWNIAQLRNRKSLLV